MTLTALARKLEMSIAGVGFAVERGGLIAKKKGFYADKLSYEVIKERSRSINRRSISNNTVLLFFWSYSFPGRASFEIF